MLSSRSFAFWLCLAPIACTSPDAYREKQIIVVLPARPTPTSMPVSIPRATVAAKPTVPEVPVQPKEEMTPAPADEAEASVPWTEKTPEPTQTPTPETTP